MQRFGAVLGAVWVLSKQAKVRCCVGIYIKQMLGMVGSEFLRLSFNFS